jgi:undecaprenyl-diphosphatase
MTIIEAIVLGVVQGLTEFLPISSTAHLRVVPALFGWGDPGAAYSAIIQLGSVVAVITYFWQDIIHIIGGAISAARAGDYTSEDFRLLCGILIGTLPICIIGLLLKHLLEQNNSPLRALAVVGAASIVMGLLLFFADRSNKQNRDFSVVGIKDGLLVGLGQALAIIPGCSRSGSTLTVAMLLNIKREDAARFSFLLGIPAIVLSGLLELKECLSTGVDQSSILDLLIGFVFATIFSYLSIGWLLKYLKSHSTNVFVIYRLIFGTTVLLLATNSQIH